ncbi:hypothetical protein PoB_007460100 [Plakobranchus ocellatus]|uniref:Uncharacterized protein n=1 Tax=Plakobranchus ocellatus TaxID=259542 RepID=A0AAV4DVG1_9GAST|nr:hypothetical protein PoB_007460100 [Plakobranchus ocellatus]
MQKSHLFCLSRKKNNAVDTSSRDCIGHNPLVGVTLRIFMCDVCLMFVPLDHHASLPGPHADHTFVLDVFTTFCCYDVTIWLNYNQLRDDTYGVFLCQCAAEANLKLQKLVFKITDTLK